MESILYSTQGEMGRRVLGLHHRHIHWEIPSAKQVKGAPAGELQVKRVGLSHALTTFSGGGGGIVKSLQATVAPKVSTREQQQARGNVLLGHQFLLYLDITISCGQDNSVSV